MEQQHQTKSNFKNVERAVEFLEKHTSSKDLSSKLENSKSHEEVIKLASEQGYEITKETLAEAMKIVVDRSLEKGGIPSWIRYRVQAPVHD